MNKSCRPNGQWAALMDNPAGTQQKNTSYVSRLLAQGPDGRCMCSYMECGRKFSSQAQLKSHVSLYHPDITWNTWVLSLNKWMSSWKYYLKHNTNICRVQALWIPHQNITNNMRTDSPPNSTKIFVYLLVKWTSADCNLWTCWIIWGEMGCNYFAEFGWLHDGSCEKRAKCTLKARVDFMPHHGAPYSADLATVSKCCFIINFLLKVRRKEY